ncbi:MAG: class I SAM-dependent methyltransferase [Pseudomonadota bacterium]
MAETELERKNLPYAIEYYMRAIRAAPENLSYKQRFLDIAANISLDGYQPGVEDIILQCLKTPDTNFSFSQNLWYSALLTHPGFQALYVDADVFNKKFDSSPFLHACFVEGVRRMVIYDLTFENFMQRLRRWLLTGLASPESMPAHEDYTRLADAVSAYCYETEYIFEETDEERARVEKLRVRIESGETADPLMLAVYACYEPPCKLQNIPDALLHGLPSVACFVQENLALESSRKSLKSQDINDSVSLEVQKQYEEFPYPRWRAKAKMPQKVPSQAPCAQERHLLNKTPEILVAGCGTGYESLQRAIIFPDGHVTAIDLSSTSLAYAAMRAGEYGANNLTFKKMDILDLKDDPARYDLISSHGVLHHMREPLTGWGILCDLLKEGGAMKIALYSKTARRFITHTRDVIRKNGYTHDRKSMAAFRKKSPELLDNQTMMNLHRGRGDYYSMSMYRDLLFHVQEHCFDLLEIEKALDDLDLTFSGFELGQDVMEEYRKEYPDDSEGISLKNWHRFEQANPDTFRTMYRFWCQK